MFLKEKAGFTYINLHNMCEYLTYSENLNQNLGKKPTNKTFMDCYGLLFLQFLSEKQDEVNIT